MHASVVSIPRLATDDAFQIATSDLELGSLLFLLLPLECQERSADDTRPSAVARLEHRLCLRDQLLLLCVIVGSRG
jgi:hypothetical protein